MIFKVEKLWNGFASVRSDLVQRCIDQREDLIIIYEDDKMTVPLKRLLHPLQLVPKEIKSKYVKDMTYKLYDFKFIPDKDASKVAQFKQGRLF